MTPETLGHAKWGWDILKSAFSWRADHRKSTPIASSMIALPHRRSINIMPSPRPNTLWWCKAQSRTGSEAMQISCELLVTNLTKLDITISAVKLLKPKSATCDATFLVEDCDGKYRSLALIPPDATPRLTHCVFFAQPVAAAPGKPLTVHLELSDQFGNRHRIKGLHIRYVGAPR